MTVPPITVLPDPFTMDWKPWAEVVAGYNASLSGQVDPDDPWPEFARRLCVIVPQAPQPDAFAEWQDWAAATKLVLGV